ncbi:hypothetical protein HHO41_12880 [Bacillus sp. DNRA2]|uniref:hypothetical protein n=1 Tax=Bacillus sp. DNRA2 TaxID=2723053 RepID=UPI00145DA488|nr:hypothetical protein [Bacillus sp. DNRA2]
MEAFPIIHTNFWDALIAVPTVIILTQIFKKIFPIPKPLIPTLANVIGFIISIFFAHRHNLWAGILMGAFYGNAAVGIYAALKTQIKAYRNT